MIDGRLVTAACWRYGRDRRGQVNKRSVFEGGPFSVRHSCAAAKLGADLSNLVNVVDVTAKPVSLLDTMLVSTDHMCMCALAALTFWLSCSGDCARRKDIDCVRQLEV